MSSIAGYIPDYKLRESQTSTLLTGRHPGTSQQVILKVLKGEHPNNEKIGRFRNEYFLLSSFNSPYIVKTYGLEIHNNSLVIVLENWLKEFTLLEEMLLQKSLPLELFLQISEQLVTALSVIHENRIIHRRVTPDAILISSNKKRIRFLDFSLAIEEGSADKEQRNPTLPDTIIPYVSPEQTGRIEQQIDHRSDLYSLGVVLFQMATGSLPFSGATIGEIIHAHLALSPVAPDSINTSLPPQVAEIILKLLEKIPANRYQSCQGLLHDLRLCRRLLKDKGKIEPFPLAIQENTLQPELSFTFPSRTRELNVLQGKLSSTLEGRLETLFITGDEGVGKSSLVSDFLNTLPRDTTYSLLASFEEKGSTAHHLRSLIRQLVQKILTERSDSINLRKVQTLRTLGTEAASLTATFPETAQLIGPQHPPEPLSPFQEQQRLSRIVGRFLKTCSETGPMLILFLDDLQNADAEALDLFHHILSSARIKRMLCIGAFRVEERQAEQLTAFLEALKSTTSNIEYLELKSLKLNEIVEILATTLNRDPSQVEGLAELCLRKTGGNPFFLKEFLIKSKENGDIFYNSAVSSWEWNLSSIDSSLLTRNRADDIKRLIPQLSQAAVELLTTAACLGNSCPLDLLSALVGHQPDHELKNLLSKGLVFTSRDEVAGTKIHFSHAYIRKEALSRLNSDERAAIRLRAGRHLLYTLPQKDYDKRITEIARYLGGQSVRHVASRTERLEISRVHFNAGQKSLQEGQYRRAHTYFTAGIRTLPKTSWETDYDITLALYTGGCESSMLCGNLHQNSIYFRKVCKMARRSEDTCQAYLIRIRMLKGQGRPADAIHVGQKILYRLGIRLPTNPSRLSSVLPLSLSWLRINRLGGGKRLRRTKDLRDRRIRSILLILRECSTAAYSASPHLLPYIADQTLRLSLGHGKTPESMVSGLITLSLTLCGFSPRTIKTGFHLGNQAMGLLEGNSQDTESHRFAYTNFVSHWQTPLRESLPPLRRNLIEKPENQYRESMAHAAGSLSHRHYLTGTNLSTIAEVASTHYRLVKKLNQQSALRRLGIVAQAVDNLLGKTADPLTLSGPYYDEKDSQTLCLQTGDMTSYTLALTVKLIHAVIFGDYQQAIYCSDEAEPYLSSLAASPYIPVFYGYSSLARLANYHNLSTADKLYTRIKVSRQQRLLRHWAKIAPQNYSPLYTLVEAEKKRVLSLGEKAMELYDHAIHLAHEHQFIREEALAYELAARYYTLSHKPHIARIYLREARYCYYRWGATAKFTRLDNIGVADPLDNMVGVGLPANLSLGQGASRLDMLTVIKASRILSSEMLLDTLLQKVMRIMLESGGAQKGALIFHEDNDWFIKIWGSSSREPHITPAKVSITRQSLVPAAIINYVCNSAKDIVLEDASSSGEFIGDPYIQENRPRSILCMPIIHQGEIFCILYLENNLATGTFPPDRQELIQLLGVHAAISLKNAQLFDQLADTVDRLNQEIVKRQEAQQQLLHAEKLSALGRLSASLAHEFGNPLMGVKYLLEDFAKRKDMREGDQQLVKLGLEECDRMKSLIHNLQQLNKPSTGKKKLTDIHSLIDYVLTFQKKHFSANNIKVFKLYDRSLPMILIIVDQVTQVLLNLTMNAVDAMPGGGELSVTTRRNKMNLIIEVEDTGSGIPREYRERVFEPFFSTKQEEDGTGLGLSISYGIAKHHDGDLTFTSMVDGGTTFALSLPILESEEDSSVSK